MFRLSLQTSQFARFWQTWKLMNKISRKKVIRGGYLRSVGVLDAQRNYFFNGNCSKMKMLPNFTRPSFFSQEKFSELPIWLILISVTLKFYQKNRKSKKNKKNILIKKIRVPPCQNFSKWKKYSFSSYTYIFLTVNNKLSWFQLVLIWNTTNSLPIIFKSNDCPV